ncbi:phospholipase/carboxylesterase [Rhizobium sp. BK313]|jgi:phospholipase/carboxylesterase|uniref:alpha/beta hydrolase n=1 Tax=Rhizobium sp. BK313 TaxID=2587081 RepID=UPI00105BAA3E|nr:esterase [Rhizobium sp. BK313]MBB3453059.1 phospholipase/carboxylesterase [Rhizobium sp. BK313]
MPELSGFYFVAGRERFSSRPLVLLHGSGRSEADLVPLADEIAPQRPYMALRGGVGWEDGFAFFRRNPDRSLDYDDLREQTALLCRLIGAAIEQRILRQPPILLGFSNGAIMAASILRTQPGLASGAILLRPLSPAPEEAFPSMRNLPVLITAGEDDERRQPDDAVLVKTQFENCHADVSSYLLPTGHGLHESEAGLIRDWLIQKGL